MKLLNRSGISRVDRIAVLVALIVMAFSTPALAAVPVILATYVDLGAATLTIQGANFGAAVPTVKLAGQPLVVQQSNQTEIVATLPPGLTEGSYVLGVKKVGAAEVKFVVTLDVEAAGDGPGREIQGFASSTGQGPNPNGTTQFFGSAATVTVAAPAQYVLVVASNAFGTAAASANSLNLFVCYQPLASGVPSGPIHPVGNGILGIRLPAFSRVTQVVHKVVQLAEGTYLVGMCGNSGSAHWVDNDWGMTSTLVF